MRPGRWRSNADPPDPGVSCPEGRRPRRRACLEQALPGDEDRRDEGVVAAVAARLRHQPRGRVRVELQRLGLGVGLPQRQRERLGPGRVYQRFTTAAAASTAITAP